MKRFLVCTLVLLVLGGGLVPTVRSDISTLQLVRVKVTSAEQAAYLVDHFDETHNHSAGEIELLLWPGDRARLDSLGYDYSVITQDLVARDAALESTLGSAGQQKGGMPGPDLTDYRRLADYNDEMAALAKKNPNLVKLFEMEEPSLEGRTIFGIEIADDVKVEDGRPIFYIDGIHHAREWPASEYTMIYAHYLVESFGKDAKVTSLLKKARVIVVPIVNVDGFDYSRESPAQNSTLGAGNGFEGYWRKNRRSLTGVTIPVVSKNPDAYGVDPNRNYAYLWGDSNGGSSGTHVDQTYRGDAPFSEPEVRNVRDIILGRSVTGVLTNHTYQASVLRTGGGKAPEDALLEKIGQQVADILGYKNQATVGYPTTGTTDDWAYAAMASLGFTIEHGSLGFHPPYEQEVGAYWKPHMKAFDVLFEMSANPKYHSVIKGKVAGGQAELTLTKKFQTPLSPGNPTGEESFPETQKLTLKTNKDGSFEWHVGPSTRPYVKGTESFTLTIKQGGKTETLKVVVDRGEIRNLGTISL